MRKAPLMMGSLLFAFGSTLAAQSPMKVTWNCAKPDPVHQLPVTDQPNHAYLIEQVHCTTTAGEIGGVKEKEGAAVEFVEAIGNNSRGHGVFVETMANGDKITYTYTLSGTMANNMMQSGSNSWTAVSGTGKFQGITAKGTCTAKGKPDGSGDFACSGTYTLK